MADMSGEAILNEAALKRLDPYVKTVIDTAKFVALYTFKLKENKWEKTGVEGSLFVYSRTGEPFYNILVLNRLNANNLIEPISSKLTLQIHEPFLLYLNSKCRLYGMWFYEKEECTRLASLIEKLAKELGDGKRSPNNVKPSNGNGLDICNLLTRAQEAYNTSKINEAGNNCTRLRHQECETPQSVMEFFAKAGNAPKKVPLPSPHIRPESLPDEGEKGLTNPLIHQLMSNPVHLVEHIEKQQRMVTPQPSDMPSSKILKSLMKQSVESNRKKIANGCPQVSHASLTTLLSPPVLDCGSYPILACSSMTETPKKPALMPPAMFTPPNHKKSTCVDNDIKLEPLTRNQLFQAINYLLRNDPVFMTKIHEAYVKSLTDKVL